MAWSSISLGAGDRQGPRILLERPVVVRGEIRIVSDQIAVVLGDEIHKTGTVVDPTVEVPREKMCDGIEIATGMTVAAEMIDMSDDDECHMFK